MHDWRTYANPQEAFELEALETNARQCLARRLDLNRQIAMIRNRCLQRRRYAQMKDDAS